MNPQLLLLIVCSLVGFLMVEVGAISKRAKDAKFSLAYYLRSNKWVLTWNALGVVALLLCHQAIIQGTYYLIVTKGGMDPVWVKYVVAPIGIVMGYGGGRLVRVMLNKGATKLGLEDALVEVQTEVTPEAVKTTTTIVTPTAPVTPTDAPQP